MTGAATAPKLDFRKSDRALYSGVPGRIVAVDVPPMTYLAIDGAGAPESAAYAAALAALYPLAYGIKFRLKARGADFTVPPLQAIWTAADISAYVRGARDEWRWTAMLRLPDSVTGDDLEQVRALVLAKPVAREAATVTRVRLTRLHEGLCLQLLHIGPYSAEGPVLHHLHTVEMPLRGLTFAGDHHEIYLSDPRRVAPDRLRTILRQPVRPI